MRIYEAGCLGYVADRPSEILSDEAVLTITDRQSVDELTRLLRVAAVTDDMCMCLGTVSVEFLDASGARLAAVAVHHASGLRWSGWSGDAELADGMELARWLGARGSHTLLDELRADGARRAAEVVMRKAWSAAVPADVRELLPQMLASGGSDASLMADLAQKLESGIPDPVTRCRTTLAWFAAGSGADSGYPAYEALPGQLLTATPRTVVLSALDDQPITGPVWAGALRHVAGWNSRPDHDIEQLPPEVWDALLAIARNHPDANMLRRIETKYEMYRRR